MPIPYLIEGLIMSCGIGGIITHQPATKEVVEIARILMDDLTKRGTCAWGWFNGYEINKQPGDFRHSMDRHFFVNDIFSKGEVNNILLHTRAATRGPPGNNLNNHPFELNNFVMAHNGSFSSWTEFENHTGIETDSYALLYWINHYYNTKDQSLYDSINSARKEVRGNHAIWLYEREQGELYFFRNLNYGQTLYYYSDPEFVVFASEEWMVEKAVRSLGVPNPHIRDFFSDTLYHLKRSTGKIEIIKVAPLDPHVLRKFSKKKDSFVRKKVKSRLDRGVYYRWP